MDKQQREYLHARLDEFLNSINACGLDEGESSSISITAYWADGWDEEKDEKIYTFSIETKRDEILH